MDPDEVAETIAEAIDKMFQSHPGYDMMVLLEEIEKAATAVGDVESAAKAQASVDEWYEEFRKEHKLNGNS